MTTDNDNREFIDNNEGDVFLENLVRHANKRSISMGVTLLVNGALVSGQLVGPEEYFDRIASDYEKDPKVLRDIGEAGMKGVREALKNDDKPLKTIHIVDARIIVGSDILPSESQERVH